MSSRRIQIMIAVIISGILLLVVAPFITTDYSDVSAPKKHISTPKPSGNVHKLTMNVRMTDAEFIAFKKVVSTFEKKNPSISISVTNVQPAQGKSYYETLKKQAQLKGMTDITLLDTNWVEEFAALGYLEAMDDLYIEVPAEKYVASTLLPLRWNGFYWGAPFDFDPYITVYRTEILKKYNLKLPDGQLDSWIIQLMTMNRPENQKAEPIFVNANDPYQLLVLDREVLKETIKRQGSGSTQLEIRIPRSIPTTQLWGDFKAGRWVYMISSLSEALKHASPDAPMTITTIPQKPSVINREGLLFEGRSFAISGHTPYRDDAMKWVKYISNKDVQAAWYESTHQLPSIIESYANKELQATVPQVILERLDKPVHSLAKPAFSTEVGELMTIIDNVWSGKAKSDDLLDKLDQLRATE
jgi:ABC-type glycerol-3-phosphate transport system substrate-binding protein